MEKTELAPHTIYAESTPNPTTMKFVSNRYLVIDGQQYEYTPEEDLSNSPLAAKLLNLPFVSKVFIASNFVAVSKTDIIEWEDVIHQLRDMLSEFLNAGGQVIIKSKADEEAGNETEDASGKDESEFSDIEKKVSSILNEYVRPAVEGDGGAIELHSCVEGKVKVVLKGACSGCPSSTMTLKNGIESMLMDMLPGEIKEVEAING
ncbi:MAG: NifU family protein [Flavobacteriales bacterium]|nr:NifU family protein [Flavobacteriales bacterium]|tara:strand:- start:1846 stop:2460 length:615 start_codon:yes stop_codon:yes gene_type:complete